MKRGLVLLALMMPWLATHADATDDYVKREMAKRKIPALSLAVLRDGQVIKESAYGLASLELDVRATLDTSYALASMTKIFTASAVMSLVQNGRISLDQPVRAILPQLPAIWSAVTVRHLLSHTSGLPDVLTDDINATVVNPDRDAALADIARRPAQVPGTVSAYNQTGYVLLSMIIEKVSGTPYEQFVRSRVFDPAGATGLRFGDAWSIIPRRAELYTALDITPDRLKLAVNQGRPVMLPGSILRYGSKIMVDYMKPAGLLNGSVRDLVNFEIALSKGKLLTASTLDEMERPYRLAGGKSGDFGLGFVTGMMGSDATVSYGGGAATWRLAIPAKHLVVIVLTNLQGCQPEALTQEIAARYR